MAYVEYIIELKNLWTPTACAALYGGFFLKIRDAMIFNKIAELVIK